MNRYPTTEYIIGYVEVQASGDAYKDRRRTEILARLEIAKQIKVSIKSAAIDIICEGEGKLLFDKMVPCKNQVAEVVETSVDLFLEGSKIVDTGENKPKGAYYAVAVFPKREGALKAADAYKESVENTSRHIKKAKTAEDASTKNEELIKAREELLKSAAYNSEKNALENTKESSDELFNELAGEIAKVNGRQ